MIFSDVCLKFPTHQAQTCTSFGSIDENLDTGAYDIGWQSLNNTIVTTSPWIYQEASDYIRGPSIVGYPSYHGGYLTNLPDGYQWAQFQMTNLRDHSWIDNYTRIIALEVNMYNPATQLLSLATVHFEFTPIGVIESTFYVQATQYVMLTSRITYLVAEILYLIFMLVYTVWEIIKLWRTRNFHAYFCSFWTYIDLIIMLVSYACVPIFILRFHSEWSAMEQYGSTGGASHVSLHALMFWDRLISYLLGILLFMVMLTFMKLLRFNKRMLVLSSTFRLIGKPLGAYIFILIIAVLSFVAMAFSTIGTSCRDYSTIQTSVMSILSLALLEIQIDQEECALVSPFSGPLYFFLVGGIFVAVFYPLMQAILDYAVTEMRGSLANLTNELELLDVIWGRLMVACGCWKISRYHSYVEDIFSSQPNNSQRT